MINVTVGEQKPQEKPFPKLMISDNTIVLFSEPNVGVVISSKGKCSGFYAKTWGMHLFTDYNEPVTLQNS